MINILRHANSTPLPVPSSVNIHHQRPIGGRKIILPHPPTPLPCMHAHAHAPFTVARYYEILPAEQPTIHAVPPLRDLNILSWLPFGIYEIILHKWEPLIMMC